MTNPTIPADELSFEVVQQGFRQELQAYADDATTPLSDADDVVGERGDPWPNNPGEKPPFVVTSYPDRPLYPHLVVDEADDSAEPIDRRQSQFKQHDYAVEIQVVGRSSTEMFGLKDGVRGFLTDREEALESRGFADPTVSGSPDGWDSTAGVAEYRFTVEGIAHTRPPE